MFDLDDAMAADRLSALPDDLLQHILSFAPARVAAASAILSRRWRPLWPRTNAVNLDIRSYLAADDKGFSISSSTVDVFFHDAFVALSAFPRRTCLKRLTLFLSLGRWYGADHDEPGDDGKVAGLLVGYPATAELEELLIGSQFSVFISRNYGLPVASLPCAAMLRVLDLERCNLQPPSAPTLSFPRLTDLRLRNCFFVEGYLQAMLDAAPTLTRLLLINVAQKPLEPPDSAEYDYPTYRRLPLRLRCLTCTVLELEAYAQDKEFEASGHIGIQLDMPSLQSFRYVGHPGKLTLISPAPGLVRVNLDATYKGHLSNSRPLEPMPRMLASFSTTRALKLTVSTMEDILKGEKEHGGVILPTFPNLKLLHLDVIYESRTSSIMALSMARLLHSCPAMSELRLMMWWNYDYVLQKENNDPSTNAFAQSMDRFEKLACTTPSHSISKVSDLPAALSDDCASVSCLRTSLRKVTLLFQTKEVDCFQVQLAKFLVENAMVLEEMYVHDGNQFWPEHIRHKLARWRADSFRTRNLQDAASFQVHPLVW